MKDACHPHKPHLMTPFKETQMSNVLSRPIRLAATLAVVGFLAACATDSEVRDGPQEVHPSPSELAKVPLY